MSEPTSSRRPSSADLNADLNQQATTSDAAAVKAQRRFSVWRQLRAVCTMDPRRLGAVLMQAYADWSSDGATRLGAALAYYTLFSIAPLLIVITGVAGVFLGLASSRQELATW